LKGKSTRKDSNRLKKRMGKLQEFGVFSELRQIGEATKKADKEARKRRRK
jgi:hypothetical protein